MHTDTSSKTSGFGIGELAGVPESTLLDDLAAEPLMMTAAPAKPVARPYEVTCWNPAREEIGQSFATLPDALAYMRSVPADWHGTIHYPGYTVGDLIMPGILKWRTPKRLEQPRWSCNECGGHVENGRCTRCGERDMISYETHGYDNHVEIRIGDVWITPGAVITAGKFVWDCWYWATGPVDELRRNHRFDCYEFRIGDQWFNATDCTVRAADREEE